MSRFSIKLVFFTLSIVGLLCIPFLSYKLIPDNTNPSLQISYNWTKASQASIESKVTSKLEGVFSTLKKVKSIYSESHTNYGEIFLEYDKTVDIEKERFKISTIIRQVYPGLPKEMSYPKISYQRPENNDIRLLSYSIISNNESRDIKTFIDKILLPRIKRIEGVNDVKIEGIPSFYYEIKYNTKKINSFKVDENSIIEAIENRLYKEQLGEILYGVAPNSIEMPVLVNIALDEDYLYNLPIIKKDFKVVKLKDIASIEKKSNIDIHQYRINGIKTISFSVIADKNVNQIDLANSIKSTVEEIREKVSSYDFLLTNDSTIYLKKELKNILFRTGISFLFLFIITILFYRNIYYVACLFTSLIATLLLAVIVFKIFKIDIHIYSLMSIAISIGFVIDNSIITIDHFLNSKDKSIILPILAATLTTIAPLILVVFLDDSVKLNLIDFSWSLIIVLLSSLAVSFFLVPSIIKQKKSSDTKWSTRKLGNLIRFNHAYMRIILFFKMKKVFISLVLIFLFGVPLFMLPEKIKDNSYLSEIYNKTFGSDYYVKKIRPTTDVYLGGVLKLFVDNSTSQNFIENPKRLNVSVRINTPFGSTINYINNICKNFENAISNNKPLGVDFFKTKIYNNRTAQIDVFFIPSKEATDFPFKLKGFLEKESLSMSGVDFYIFGVGKPFGTAFGESIDGNLILTGYDYVKLNEYALKVKDRLKQNSRIENIEIKSEPSWYAKTNKKYELKSVDGNRVSIMNNLYQNFSTKLIGNYKIGKDLVPLNLVSDLKLDNSTFTILNKQFRINDSLYYKPKYNYNINLEDVTDKIVKKNQEYQLVLQYKFLGTYKHNQIVKKEIIDEFSTFFISGFKIKDDTLGQGKVKHNNLYLPLLICMFIIFSVASILLESFRKSLIIILIVPITFIGVFFSLYKLEIGFSQGVYAALILLIGLLVNSSIFIINEFTIYNKKIGVQRSYLKAFNKKIIPVVVTITSTVIGLLPFLMSDAKNNFWYPFAITICFGLVFSTVVLIFILPIYLIPKKEND